MKIQNLENIELQVMVDCMLEAFKGYFVPMPADLKYWKDRFKGARVDFGLSFGAFDDNKLVGYIMHGIDDLNGEVIAFNTGTGVIEKYRGNKLVDRMYEVAFPVLQQHGVNKCQLEVIQDNARAIRVYERIGFETIREFKCYKGKLSLSCPNIKTQKIAYTNVQSNDTHYSWDHKNKAIKILSDKYECYQVINQKNNNVGYFVINTDKNYIAQFESKTNNYHDIMCGISQLTNEIRIILIVTDCVGEILPLLIINKLCFLCR